MSRSKLCCVICRNGNSSPWMGEGGTSPNGAGLAWAVPSLVARASTSRTAAGLARASTRPNGPGFARARVGVSEGRYLICRRVQTSKAFASLTTPHLTSPAWGEGLNRWVNHG